MIGSSPRTRGTPRSPMRRRRSTRLIPADAGNTNSLRLEPIFPSAHPRGRGEHLADIIWGMLQPGSSPRTRGTRTITVTSKSKGRLIPADAGNTSRNMALSFLPPAHPRGRGEHMSRGSAEPPDSGSSPRTRGTRGGGRRGRARGGSSPRTRGTHGLSHGRGDILRLIPADAGNTAQNHLFVTHTAAHPRGRGEHAYANLGSLLITGSSPRTRGTREGQRPGFIHVRLIPADAGNTERRRRSACAASAHPRGRGEHLPVSQCRPRKVGSSPRTRGTPNHEHHRRREARLIPADAGNTAYVPRLSPIFPAHPRGRGEHSICQRLRV